ncbi:WD40 repeat-like protein [Laetiporus sulphureus 93-53]|uniref:WD40 repeat-like protein n=1 Tax=Laetiporus sulphureus 93-53 TaxID=1314785 RepID=A0A165BR08_9APHY|nr:WD40 repeat-like protein [Laetiporus sulphureus 93-53]KZT01496.1 WD40 repeat-like protein [Laetiporus sulphureus 93-53]
MSEMILKKMFSAHDLPVNAIAISNDGTVMLTEADDGCVIAWDMKAGEKLEEISCIFHGPVISVCWIDLGKGDNLAFVCGCADDTLQVYQRADVRTRFSLCSVTSAHKGFVQDINFDTNNGRIASAGGGTVSIWKLNGGGSLESMTTDVPDKGYMLQSVHFCDSGDSILLCYCESHEIVDPWSLKWAKQLPTRIGHSVLSPDEQNLFILNLISGVDQYKVPSLERIRSYSYPIARNQLMQVCVLGTQLVIGGDDGFARLYDIGTGRLVQMLEHSGDATLVQTVSTHEGAQDCVIVTASTGDGPSEIRVWSRLLGIQHEHENSSLSTSWSQTMMVAFLTAAFMTFITSDNDFGPGLAEYTAYIATRFYALFDDYRAM